MNITIKRSNITPAIKQDVHVKTFKLAFELKRNAGVTAEPIRGEDKDVLDYKDVKIRGYLSTWNTITAKDRDGEWILAGAFRKSIDRFMRNPILLLNHRNETGSIAGRFTHMVEDERGLYIEATIGNAPGLRDVRFHVAEGNLKTLSIGGAFRYDDDGRGIKEVELFEGSLTPVPSNPDARFEVFDLSEQGKRHIIRGGALGGLKAIEFGQSYKGSKVHPGENESKEDFMTRCMGALSDEYDDVDQRFAVCNRYWEAGPKAMQD